MGKSKPGSFLGLGTPVLPPLPMHGGDRNRTSPFAFTGNKFEFRALGSSASLSMPNTVLNTIVAEAIDDLSSKLATALKKRGATLEDAARSVIKDSWTANKQIIFGGDNYAEEWHKEAEKRGLLNLRNTVDALPQLVSRQTVGVFGKYDVLSKREIESRHEVFLEQYIVKLNIEAETAASIARTLLLPAAVRHLNTLTASGATGGETPNEGLAYLIGESRELIDEFTFAIQKLEAANLEHEDGTLEKEAKYMRDVVVPAMDAVREVADRLERIVADDLWPLPKYSEILFIK